MRKLTVSLSVLWIFIFGVSTVLAAAPYPSTPPDFSHPGSPHEPLFSPTGGNTDRPMLVIYVQFSDVTFPTGLDAAWVATRYFGPFPSVADYYSNDSFGKLILTPAAESDTSNNGAANDGVVSITISSPKATFTALTASDQNKQILQAVDPFVNFATFDTNGNGSLTDLEIVVNRIDAAVSPPGPVGCGATRGVDPVSLDGKNMTLSVAMDGTDSNLMTIIHETGHVAFHMRDLYGFGVGSFDTSGPTCGGPETMLFRMSSWQKMHLDWTDPTVVVQDGYYNVNRTDTTGQSFILYDPDKGTDNYFMVENRVVTANTYDRSAADSGLVIWRIDDAQYNSGSDTVRPIELMRPDGTMTQVCNPGCYGGSASDAWNPADLSTPQRTMNRTWRDGTTSLVAVRAIGPAGNVIRAYFDVRGPGILVDPTTATGLPRQVDVTPEEANPVTFTVMNTGEATDTFNFTVGGLPAGWTSSTNTQTLGAGAGSVANVQVTVPANAAVGVYTVKAVGQSTTDATIKTEAEFTLRVVLHQTKITYTGLTSVPWGQPAGFAAQVSDLTNPAEMIVGATVTFNLTNGTNTQTVTALTNATGLATANPILAVPPGNYTLTASVARLGKHDAATTNVAYVVERRPTVLVYTGVLSAQYSDPAALSAVLTDQLSSVPLAGMTVSFTLGTQSGSGVTDAAGTAATTIIVNQPSGALTVDSAFAGDALYLPSTDSDAFQVNKEQLSFVYVGDTLAALGTTPMLAAQATEEADGFPGDLSLAEVTFHLVPTLTLVPFDYTTGLDAAGYGSTLATGLPADLWTVTESVPASNLYWEGVSALPVELVVFDPNGSIAGGGHGVDASSAGVSIEFTGRYHDLAPKGVTQLRSTLGRFFGKDFDWIVVAGNQAIWQLTGDLAGQAVVLRVQILDADGPGVPDTFRAWIKDLSATLLYDSGTVVVDGGKLQVLKP